MHTAMSYAHSHEAVTTYTAFLESDESPTSTEFKDLIDLSSYTDPITIMIKFRRGSNSTTQDRIPESGTDRRSDMDFNGWFKAA
jgi:hypothetical protein